MPLFDFGYGEIPAHQHNNGRGWVADTAIVAPTAFVGSNAIVYGNATVNEFARIDLLKKTTKCMCLIMNNFGNI